MFDFLRDNIISILAIPTGLSVFTTVLVCGLKDSSIVALKFLNIMLLTSFVSLMLLFDQYSINISTPILFAIAAIYEFLFIYICCNIITYKENTGANGKKESTDVPQA